MSKRMSRGDKRYVERMREMYLKDIERKRKEREKVRRVFRRRVDLSEKVQGEYV